MPKGTSDESVTQHFVKHAEATNFRRASVFKARKNKSLLVALTAALFAVGTYALSINAVRQGRYLDKSFDKLPDSK